MARGPVKKKAGTKVVAKVGAGSGRKAPGRKTARPAAKKPVVRKALARGRETVGAQSTKTTKKAKKTTRPAKAAVKSGSGDRLPLAGIRVLDLSRVLAGPWAGQNLADLGAEVIKVERPNVGDDTRSWGPPFLKDAQGNATREAAYFLGINRSKRSITIDIARPEGQDLVRQLAAKANVILENYKVGTLKRFKLDYASLRKVNPGLIYCSITGFGQDGPYAERPAYDFLIQGMSGLMSITGEREDKPGGGPMKVGIPIADLMTGLYADIAILGALAWRARSGKGQHIDLALLDVQIAVMTGRNLGYFVTGVSPNANGNEHPNIVPQTVYPCRDGHLIVVVGNDGQFVKFCEALDLTDMARDARFATNPQRVINREALNAAIIARLALGDRAHWVAKLEEAGVPCGPINTVAQVFDDPQVKHRGMKIHMRHPLAGQVPLVANPIKYSQTPIRYRSAPPLLGQHTSDVLKKELGLSAARIAELKKTKVI
jgi:crotonobetainyl-CoA:carnitine CoA-transferase CaiB-like acyl-CoA transferase